MRKLASVAGLCSILLLNLPSGFAATPAAKPAPGTLVIVFKDGHRQSYNLADVERVEFPSGDAAGFSSSGPSRGHFLGKWEVGDGNGNTFSITLEENGDAMRSIGGNVHGRWAYVNGEAQIRWDDGPQDAIRRVGSHFQKFAYGSGKLFTDVPDNVTNARNTTPKPI